MSFRRRLAMWLRVTYLDRWTSALAAILVAVTLLTSLRGFSVPILDWTGYAQYWLPVAAVMAGYYGYSRARHFHPLSNTDYGDWLYDRPWIYPQPLPMGPWHFVWQDVLFVGILALVASVGGVAFPLYFDTSVINCSLLIVALFVSGYAWTTFVNAALCYERYGGLGMPLIYASLLWVWAYPLVVAALLLLATLLAHFSARRLLIHFHDLLAWRSQSMADRYSLSATGIGWPYDHLLVWIRRPVIPIEHALSLSVVAGWCAATLAHIPYFVAGHRNLAQGDYDDLLGFVNIVLVTSAVVLISVRSGQYFRGMRMPISLLGRLATGHWIIPRFDRALVPLVLLFLVGWFLPQWAAAWGTPLEAIAGVTVTLLVLIATGMGPTLDEWWHTGDQQIVFTKKKKQTTYISTQ